MEISINTILLISFLLFAPPGRPHDVSPPCGAPTSPFKVSCSSFDVFCACCNWYIVLLNYSVLQRSICLLVFLQNAAHVTTHTTRYCICRLFVQLCSLVEFANPRAPATTLTPLFRQGVVQKNISIFPLKRLHFLVIVPPPT